MVVPFLLVRVLSLSTPAASSLRAPRGLEPRGNISHEKMSFVQSGDEAGSASCVSPFRHRSLLASNHIDEKHAEPAPSCARAVVATKGGRYWNQERGATS